MKNGPEKSIFNNLISINKRGHLKCPDCYELMNLYSCQDVVIDKCGSCQGIWFDHKEFGVFKRTLDSYTLSGVDINFKPQQLDSISLSTCPRCEVILDDKNYSYKSGVKFKTCYNCNGIWLPLHDTLSLVELVKVGQRIAPHVKGALAGLRESERDIQKSKAMKNIANQLSAKVSYSRRLSLNYFPMILPLYDDNPRKSFPVVTAGLIVVNSLVFIFMSSNDSSSLSLIYQEYAMQPKEIVNFTSLSTLLTSMFMHADFFHLLGNMFFLWTFGDNIEDSLGRLKYFFCYLLFGFVGSFAHIITDVDSLIPTLGASGAISGLLGAYLYLFPNIKIKTLIGAFIADIPTWIYFSFWMLLQITSAALHNSKGGGVAWWAHLGGFFFGLALTAVLKKLKNGATKYSGS